MEYVYKTQGTCSTNIELNVEDGVVKEVAFWGGCNGNLQGLSRLVRGMKVYSTKHHERQDYLFVVTFLESMYQNIVGDIPDEGEECVILLVVHKILDLRVIKLQFAPLQYESVP